MTEIITHEGVCCPVDRGPTFFHSVHGLWTKSRKFPSEKYFSSTSQFHTTLQIGPPIFQNQLAVQALLQILHLGPWILNSICRSILALYFCTYTPPFSSNQKSNSSESLQFSKEALRTFQNLNLVPATSNLHIFPTVTPNQVILLPNFW
jgi:hypothetical protein